MAPFIAKQVWQGATLLVGLLIAISAAASDPTLIMSGSGSASAITGDTALAFGSLIKSYAQIVGVWYALRSAVIFSLIAGGKGAGQYTPGSVVTHFVAGTLAYNSDDFFEMVHNTIPMIPDFGRLIYDAELLLSLMN